MRRILPLLAVLALPLPANAANDTITVTITSVAASCSAGCSRVLNGPTSVNMIPILLSTYQQGCNTSINGTCTAAQVFNYWIGLVGKNLTADIQAAQTAAAVATASNGVTPVPVQ